MLAFIVSIYVYSNNIHYGYEYSFLLPFIFGVMSLIISRSYNNGIVLHLIYIIYFIRFVLLTFMVIYSGWYTGRATYEPSENSFDYAILLMTLEFIVINFFYFIFIRRLDFKLYKNEIDFNFNQPIREFVFILFIIVSILLSPMIASQISFLGIGVDGRVAVQSQLQTLIFFCVYVSKYLLIGISINYFHKKYLNKKNNIFILISVIIVLFLNSIFIGSNRMDFILPYIASFLLLNYFYKHKMIIFNFLSIAFLTIALYLISKIRNTFEYQIVEDTPSLITDYLQVYFAGIYNVALSLEINIISNQNEIMTLLYDLIRPFLGLNFLWRSDKLSTSAELFNQRIFGEGHVSQIIPLIGQFNNAFGILGILFSVAILTLLISIFLKKMRGSNIVTGLILFVLLIRIIITPVQNISIFLNEFSSIILIFISLNLIAYIVRGAIRKTS